jgi:hypothetical protein
LAAQQPTEKGGHIEHLFGRTETWSVSPSVDMLPFGVTIPATEPQRSDIVEGLMNHLVYETLQQILFLLESWHFLKCLKKQGFGTEG